MASRIPAGGRGAACGLGAPKAVTNTRPTSANASAAMVRGAGRVRADNASVQVRVDRREAERDERGDGDADVANREEVQQLEPPTNPPRRRGA